MTPSNVPVVGGKRDGGFREWKRLYWTYGFEVTNFAPGAAVRMRYHNYSKDKPPKACDRPFAGATVTFVISPVLEVD